MAIIVHLDLRFFKKFFLDRSDHGSMKWKKDREDFYFFTFRHFYNIQNSFCLYTVKSQSSNHRLRIEAGFRMRVPGFGPEARAWQARVLPGYTTPA